MNFPSSYKDLETFSKNNPDILLKVYSQTGSKNTTKKEIFPLRPYYFPRLTPEEMKVKIVVYLLLLFPPQEVINARLKNNDYDIGHFIAITDINAFMRGWRSDSPEFVCDCCGNTFRTEELRDKHINEGCYTRTTKQFELTKKDVFFNAHSKCPRNEFVQYMDSETEMDKNIDPDDDWDEEHIPQAIEAHMVSKYQHIFDLFNIPTHVQFRGKDCMKQYADYLMKFSEKIEIGYNKPISFNEFIRFTKRPINMSAEQCENYRNAKKCYICGEDFDKKYEIEQEEKIEQNERDELDEEDEDTKYTFPPLRKHCNRVKVADHDHLLEKDNFLGAAHSYCNLQRQTRRTFITVICHNAANYDWHLLIRELIKKPYQIRPIAKTAYKFISFKFGIFHFIDSRRFLNASEEKLANQLGNRNEDGSLKYDDDGKLLSNYDIFIQLKTFFENHPKEKYRNGDWRLLTKKGALPYEYISYRTLL